MGGQEPQVELHVVADDRTVADEFGELAGDAGEGRGALDLAGPDTGEPLDWVGDGTAGVHKGLEGVEDLIAPEPHRADLEDGVTFRVQAGGFQIQGNVDLFQWRNQLVK